MPSLGDYEQKNAATAIRSKKQAEYLKVWVVAIAAKNGWDRSAQRREQLNDHDGGKILQEIEAGQRSELKDIADSNSINKATGNNGTP
jgi:hypothetical protein